MKNILQELREKNHKTHQQISDSIGISTQTLIRLEHGLYEKIPVRVIEYWEAKEYVREPIVLLYNSFIQEHRSETKDAYAEVVKNFTFKPYSYKFECPFRFVRRTFNSNLSNYEFCKLLCIQVSHAYALEKNKVQNVPHQVNQALSEIGFSPFLVNEFKELTYKFGKL